MEKLLILSISLLLSTQTVVLSFPQQGQPGEGGQDSCAQYQSQCVEGSSLAGQGASAGGSLFPNNPLPVDQVQQMPYCDALAQACRAQNTTAPSAPSAPSAPEVPQVPGGGGFFNSLKHWFNL